MLEAYDDIRSRIKEEPIWFDSNGVPRYDPFSPSMCPDIYANEVVLYKICCQDCRQKFLVESHSTRTFYPEYKEHLLSLHVDNLHYGDPPIHGGCAGNTMNCIDLKVIEFWSRINLDWVRRPEHEIYLEEQ